MNYNVKAKRNGTEMSFDIKIPKKLKTANTSNILNYKVNYSQNSGVDQCISAPIYFCPKDGTPTPM